MNNITRACNEGLIDKKGTCNALSTKVEHALGKHDDGRHD